LSHGGRENLKMRRICGALSAKPNRDESFSATEGHVSRAFTPRGRRDSVFAQHDKKVVLKMMRPDHIYFAMAMVKHSTLAGACIFAAKLVYFMLKASV
jgi:hypothetical protein